MTKVLLTGATGFIGSALLQQLALQEGIEAVGLCRTVPEPNSCQLPLLAVGDLAVADLSDVLQGVDVVIHSAARAHILREPATDPMCAFRHDNVVASLNVAKQAAAAGAKRFIFISTVKVNGERTTGAIPFNESMAPAPQDAYGLSKHEAEQALRAFCSETAMELVIVRISLVYGPGAKANFLSLQRLCEKNIPLPFGAINNRRSMIFLGNLVDFLLCCIKHPAAANQLFLVSDGHDMALAELVTGLRQAMGRKARLFAVPPALFRLAGWITGRSAMFDRLVGDLQVDPGKARRLLGWVPPYSVDAGLLLTVTARQRKEQQVMTGGLAASLRTLDIVFSLNGLVLGFPLLLLIFLAGWITDGWPLFFQERVGRHQRPFTLVKFRTMRKGVASVASHLASADDVTAFGRFLRKTKLDELPQLWNVLKGEMSLVGPRPNLYSQHELIAKREKLGVYAVRPGITGLAQVSQVDMSTPELLANLDAQMIREMSVRNYFRFIFLTVAGRGAGDRIKHG